MKIFEWANSWKKQSKHPDQWTAEQWRDWMIDNRIQPSMLPEEISQAELMDPSDDYKEPSEVPIGTNKAIRKYEEDYFTDSDYFKHLLEFLNTEIKTSNT
jgi:hypothetical protein